MDWTGSRRDRDGRSKARQGHWRELAREGVGSGDRPRSAIVGARGGAADGTGGASFLVAADQQEKVDRWRRAAERLGGLTSCEQGSPPADATGPIETVIEKTCSGLNVKYVARAVGARLFRSERRAGRHHQHQRDNDRTPATQRRRAHGALVPSRRLDVHPPHAHGQLVHTGVTHRGTPPAGRPRPPSSRAPDESETADFAPDSPNATHRRMVTPRDR